MVEEDDGRSGLHAALSLVAERAARLTEDQRRRGAHYTPPALALEVAALVLGGHGSARTVVDPACGAGALLLAAAEQLAAAGVPRAVVARDLLFGADIDADAVTTAVDAITTWSGGTAPGTGHVVVADALADVPPWTDRPVGGFDAVVGNPPFQGQLARDTARSEAGQAALRARFGGAVTPYVDTAALFLLVGVELARPGARVALIQPQSTVAARDAAAVRAAVSDRARLVELREVDGQPFAARVHVCVPVLEVGAPDETADWAARLAVARGVPDVELGGAATVASRAGAVAGFRQHYYALVEHVRDGGDGAPLVTSGAIDPGATTWGSAPIRFARRRWDRPGVDVDAVRRADPRVGRWLDQVLRPKVVVASQTKVLEAAADRAGGWVPCTPVVSVVPQDAGDVDRLAAALCAPPVAAWAARRASGTGLSATSIRTSAGLLLDAPLPVDRATWDDAAAHLARGDLSAFAHAATASYGLSPHSAAAVLDWWHARAPKIRVGPARGRR